MKLRTLDVACPKCGAEPSRFCTSTSRGEKVGSRVLGRPHVERVEARREKIRKDGATGCTYGAIY